MKLGLTSRPSGAGTLALAVAAVLGATAWSAGSVHAAEPAATAAGSEGRLEEIVVTARKREETLQEAPVSITAFSTDDIVEKGFQNLEDVARISPGVQYSQMGGQIPGRYNSAIRFRGMNVNSDSPSLQLGSLFVDGIFALGGTQSIPLDDLERIEVIKGPQAALYGRSTFGGAINYITRTPSMTEHSGQASALVASKDEREASISFEGPLVPDLLAFRIGGRMYDRGALFTSGDGGALGEESSRSIQGTLYATPFSGFSARLRAFYNVDEDGPPAGGLVQGARNDTCTGKTIATQDPAAPQARPRNYICGIVPEQGQAIAADGSRNIINYATTLFPRQAAINGTPNFVVQNLVDRATPAAIAVPRVDDIGLERNVARYSAAFTYEFAGGYEATLQGGYNRLRANWIRSFGLTPLGYWFSRDPQDSRDTSYEFRLTSPGDQRITWLLGANYYRQKFIQSGSGGDAVWLCFSGVPGRPYGAPCPAGAAANFFTANNLLQNTDRVSTVGYFAAVNVDILDTLKLSLEGRQQRDSAKSAILTAQPARIDTDEFLPRGILSWQPTEATNLYVSYSKGVLPGIINAQVAAATANELRQYQQQAPTATPIIPGDELKMYEIGIKQQFLDGRAYVNVAYYQGDWENQKGRQTAVVFEDCRFPPPTQTLAQCPNGPNGQPAIQPNTRNVNVAGTSELQGVELESALLVSEGWDVRATVTWAKSEYEDFLFNFVTPIAGFAQMKGNSNARFPEWSGSLASGYTALLQGDWNWFVNADASYTGKTYVDESNLAQCDSYWLANARGGIENSSSGLRVELFVRNLADNDAWASCARWTDFDGAPSIFQLTTFQGVAVAPLNPRQYGLRASFKF